MKLEFTNNFRLLKVLQVSEIELKQLKVLATEQGYNYHSKQTYEKSYFHNSTFLPAGLWRDILKLTKIKNPFRVEIINIKDFIHKITREEFTEWVMNLDLPFDPYDYQIEAAFNAIKYNICRCEIATGGGKTLVAYLCSKWVIDHELKPNEKVLIVVPKVDLVKQTDKSFKNFSQNGSVICDTIFSGGKKIDSSNVVIGNIDSLTNYDEDYFKQFRAVVFDEAHKITTDGFQRIYMYISKHEMTFITGMSGTFHARNTIEGLTEESFLGPILLRKSAHELMKEGRIPPIKITQIRIQYDEIISAAYYTHDDIKNEDERFRIETEFLKTLPERKKLICDIVSKIEGNTILLFKGRNYLEEFINELKIYCSERKVFEYHGDIKQKQRDEIQELMRISHDVIVCATYATIDTGLSIDSIMNIVLVESAKSFIRIRQSIGRGLRLHPQKEWFTLFDIVDVLKKKKVPKGETEIGPKINSTAMHGSVRARIYKEQQFEYKIVNLDAHKIIC